jgi:hypothetical protein
VKCNHSKGKPAKPHLLLVQSWVFIVLKDQSGTMRKGRFV